MFDGELVYQLQGIDSQDQLVKFLQDDFADHLCGSAIITDISGIE